MPEPLRLNKYLVDAGVCSRREADRLISTGKILVNGARATLGQKVDGSEKIVVKGTVVPKRTTVKRVYLAFHKPIGIICTSDPKAKDNIIDAVRYPERVFHVGRLDVASSGLILLTNDGNIVNAILRAEGKHEKEYVVTIDRTVTPEFVHTMATGVEILGRKTLPAKVTKLGDTSFAITLVEGRNRQIRRMCEAMHVNVKRLERIRVMNIELGSLPKGKWRHLTPEEEKRLLASLK
jgi:23S rRNA pseudouridine2604 synthase